jgi:diguanylate cyclase (GGDEF)-like protein
MDSTDHDKEPTDQRRLRASDFQLTLTRAMLETLELKRILYVILSGITAGDGLDFNRAFLFLADRGRRRLNGQLAMGPESRKEAFRIWEEMEAQRFDLELLMRRYESFRADPCASALSRQIIKLSFPLPLKAEPAGSSEFLAMLSKVFVEQEPLLVNGTEIDLPGTSVVLYNLVMLPLVTSEEAIGVLVADNPYNRRPVKENEVRDIRSLANLAAIAVQRARLHERIRRMANVDGLTGLANRRHFDEVLPAIFHECRQRERPLSVIIVDLDEFKSINDTHGHLAGDDLLRGVSQIIKSRAREGDLAARYGGDELIVVLPDATSEEAARVGEHIRGSVESRRFGNQREPFDASVSIGVASLDPAHHQPADLLEEADRALYRSKQAGRNRVSMA